MTLSLPAFAKVNLDLRILGVRADGYHDLRTVFQSLALADQVTLRTTRGPFAITCDDPACPPTGGTSHGRRRRCSGGRRGAAAGEPRGVTVHLASGFPSEAGLGGGSADAAVTLMATEPAVATRPGRCRP
jgi:4-diphosphocytidyl-2-C-methyl-D-erythritol kinase